MIDEYNLETKDIATLVGKSRSYVSNLLRLSKLSSKVYRALKEEAVTMGQVKPLINLKEEEQDQLLSEILNLKLSSRQVEERVRNISNNNKEISEEIVHYKNFFEDKTNFFPRILSEKFPLKCSTKLSSESLKETKRAGCLLFT